MNKEIKKNYFVEKIYDSSTSTRIYKARNKHTGNIYCFKVVKGNANGLESKEKEVLKIDGHLNIRSYRFVSEIVKRKKLGVKHYRIYVSAFYNYTLRDLIQAKNDYHYGNSNEKIVDFIGLFEPGPIEARKNMYSIFKDVVRGVAYLHKFKIMHRDIKPENIFLDSKALVPRIGDFDCTKLSVGDDEIQMTIDVGTNLYSAPEISTGMYSQNIDVYSLGIIFYELLVPFNTQMERLKHILQIRNQAYEEKSLFEPELSILKACLDHETKNRYQAKQLLKAVSELI